MFLRSFFLIAFLSGCAEFPALEGTISDSARNANFPQLVPLEPLLTSAQAARLRPDALPLTDMNTRISRLQARANALRGPVIGAATLARMRAGIR